jgi:glycosyltransferase involved in cell wall biosynthesis
MVAPRRRQCGVADYTDYLLAELGELRDLLDVRRVVDSTNFTGAVADRGFVDIVHVQHQYFLFGGVAPWKNRFRDFADRLRVPAVLTAHEFVEPRGNPAAAAAIRATNRRNFLHKAVSRIIVHTEADRARMDASGIPSAHISVVRHGVPPAPPLPPRDEARRSLGVEDRFVVTVFGFLSRRKGHALAVEAMRILPPNVCLLLAGGRHPDDQTGYVDGIERLIRDGNLENRVRITGYLSPEQVAEVMSATDLILAPFTESSGSGSLALAFACGKPILASSISPHAEIVAESESALKTFRALHPGAIAMEVSSLRENPESLALLAAGARDYAAAHSYRRMAEETVSIYRNVLGRPA